MFGSAEAAAVKMQCGILHIDDGGQGLNMWRSRKARIVVDLDAAPQRYLPRLPRGLQLRPPLTLITPSSANVPTSVSDREMDRQRRIGIVNLNGLRAKSRRCRWAAPRWRH